MIQVQVSFATSVSTRIAGGRARRFQWFALLLATAGVALIILHTYGNTTPLGLMLALLAALRAADASTWAVAACQSSGNSRSGTGC